MPDAIAIDFGTTRTKTAYWDERAHSPRLVRLGYGDEPFVPSLFYLPRGSEQILWGYDAEEYLEEDPAGIVDVLKRRLQDRYVFANRRKISPKALLTLMFRRLREQVGQEVLALQGTPPGKAVMTLPALYGPAVEKLLREAAQAAAFTEVELVPEPVAAAQAWLVQTEETVRSVGVLDCGGGTLDLAYLGYEHGQFRIIPECPPGGDTHVGGHDVDRELMNLLREQMPEAAEELAQRQPFYLRQVRVLKERYCRGLPLRPLRVSGQTLELDAQDIQAVLEERFIAQTCESLKAYLGRVVALTGGEPPPVLLVGGSARIKGLREAVEAQVGCQALWWERSEFATVLGAISTSENKQEKSYKPYQGFRDHLKDGTPVSEMVYLPGGSFKMGDIQGEGLDRERPVHEVTLEAFAIGRNPLTVGEFRRFVEATGYKTEAEQGDGAYVYDGKEWGRKSDASWRNPYMSQDDDHPVVCISWNDAVAYCEWLSEQTGESYSLPTEAEWEYACRAESDTAYCFGDDEKLLGDYAWYAKNAEGKTHPVGKKRPNDWYLYDMHGNVWEWVLDWYSENYYKENPRENPSGPEQGSYRVIRGGSWFRDAVHCRSACRAGVGPGIRNVILGFRLARRV
jgi:formylglycine-generating enzyme required for sulfatase activity